MFCGLESGAATKTSPERITVSGQEYVRLATWAKDNALQVQWIKKNDILQLTGRSARIRVKITSREADVSGVKVWLLLPVVSKGGYVYLAKMDVVHTFEPILSPPRCKTGTSVKTICLDAGHGGTDPGHRTGNYQEKRYTLLLAQELRTQLQSAGFKVILTRSTDTTVDLEDRAVKARKGGADLLLSLHFNAGQSARSSARGCEVYCLTPAGAASTNSGGEGSGSTAYTGNRQNDHNMALAFHIQKALIGKLGTEDRGVRRARFMVLKGASMPAALIEAGFLSHPTEGPKIAQTAYRQQMARAIVDGVKAYKRQVER